MYDGLNIDENFLRAYGKDLDEYADSFQKISKEADTSVIGITDFNNTLAKQGKQTVKSTTLLQDLGSGLKSVGKTALSIAGNVGLDLAISTGLQLAGQAWSDYANQQENAIERGEDALKNYRDSIFNSKMVY